MQETLTLADFAARLADRFGTATEAEKLAVTSFDVKKQIAAELLRGSAAATFMLAGNDIDAVAAIAADPISREVAHEMIGSRPYRDPATSWASESVTPTLDYMFGDRGRRSGEGVAVVIPARWSIEVWSSDSDLDDAGWRRWHHWPIGNLPSVVRHDSWETPMRVVWLSGQMYGTLQWGATDIALSGRRVVLYDAVTPDVPLHAAV